MSKKSSFKSPITERIGTPGLQKDKDGNLIILCPFCNPPHSLRPGHISGCGTTLNLQAVQRVVRSKYANTVCAKCGKKGGEMVRWQNAYIHTYDCAPGTVAMTVPPKFSKFARRVYMLPEWAKCYVEMITGRSMPVSEVTLEGVKTGTTLGYFFLKGRNK